MYLGDFDEFGIHYEITNVSDSWVFGFFNLVIKGEFHPAKKSNWTLNSIFSGFTDFLRIYDQHFLCDSKLQNLSAEELYGLILSLKGASTKENIGINLPLREIEDLGYDFYVLPFENFDLLLFSKDYGKTAIKIKFDKEIIVYAIESFTKVNKLILNN